MPELHSLDVYQLDPQAIRRAFDKAAFHYDGAAALQVEVRSRLHERLKVIRTAPQSILDFGAGTGESSRWLKRRYPRAQVVALDLSPRMLQIARRKQSWFRPFARVCARGVQLPLADGTIDWCVSNLALPWCTPPDLVFKEVQRVLKPNGLFSFTTLGPDTLRELRIAWSSIDAHPHVHRFVDMHDLGDALLRAGFAEPVMDVERIVLTYATAEQLMRELKNTGATTATVGRARDLGNRGRLRALKTSLLAQTSSLRLTATFEVVYGQAWRGDARPLRQ